jgi:hypothetical protein
LRLRALLRSTWALALVVVLVAWRPLFTTPTVGLDPSWSLGLQMAATDRLHWGTDFIFTYGPLAFLRVPMVAFTWASILSTIYITAVRFALAASVIWLLRRRLHVAAAAVVAFIALNLGTVPAVPLAFIWCAVAIAPEAPAFAPRLVVFGGALLSGVELLVKLNEGLLITLMCLVALLAMPGLRRGRCAWFAGTLSLWTIVLWFASGQGAGNVDDFMAGAYQLLRGYSSALAQAGTPRIAVVAVVVFIAATAAAYVVSRTTAARTRRGLILLVVLFGFFAWKEGFVRQDAGHMQIYFGWMLMPWLAFLAMPRPSPAPFRTSAAWPVAWLGCFAAVGAIYFHAIGQPPTERLDPLANTKTAVSDLRTVFEPARRRETRDAARFSMGLNYRLDLPSALLLQGHTVHVWPWENGIVWANGLDWQPLPVPRTTTAYTSWLDQRNADALASADAPERILRHATAPVPGTFARPSALASSVSIDGRFATYDAPASSVALLCNYRALRTTRRFQVLAHVRDRCGSPRPLGSTDTGYGGSVSVPSPPGRRDVVFARIHGADPGGIEAVRTFLYRPLPRYVVFNQRARYRVIPAVLDDGLILSTPRGKDFPRPFALSPNARSVGLDKPSGFMSPAGDIRFDFYAMSVR